MRFTKPLLITKLKATGIHLSLSILVFIYLAYQIYFVWYPQPYFEVDGGWQGIRLVAAVDLVLGPFITFLIFDPRKKMREIIFDLGVIVVIQFGALAYGIYATYSQRPVAVVLIDEYVISAIEENYGGKLEDVNELKRYSDEHPPIIYSDIPLSQEGIAEMHRTKIEQGILENAQMQYYRPQSELKDALRARQHIFYDRLDHFAARPGLEAWLQENGKAADEILIARLSGRYGRAWLVFDTDGKYLSYFF